ncbi:MAG TPA: PAS domain S-box protein [Bacteroidales bacterium]|nr:PAS domain S-box protein [Bacteroidales bacterium]
MQALYYSFSLLTVAIITYFVYRHAKIHKGHHLHAEGKNDFFLLGNLFWKIFSTSGHAIILLQDNKIVNSNDMACKLFGATYNDIVGKSPFDLSPEYQPDGELSVKKGKNLLRNILTEGTISFEWSHKKLNDELFLAKVSASSFELNGKNYAAITIEDITLARQEHNELQDYREKIELLLEEKTEKLEHANQELVAQNEELDTSNEELLSLNEELNATNEKLENANALLKNEITEHEKTQAEREIYRKQLESLLEQKTEYLEQLKERFTEVYSNTSDAITFFDLIYNDSVTLKVFDMNPVAQKLFSVNKEKIKKGLVASDFIPKTDYEAFVKDILPRLLAGNIVTVKKEAELTSIYWQSTLTPIKDKNGAVNRIVVFSKDITAEYERERIATILNAAIDSWPFEFWARDINGYQILQNKISRERAGNLIGKRIEDIDMPEDTRKQSEQLIKRVLSGESISIETEKVDSGQKRYIIYKLNPIFTDTGIKGYTAIAIDITERKMAEDSLRESEERFRSITRLSKNLVYDFDLKANKINWDGAIEEVTGYTFEEYKDVSFDQWVEMIHPDDKEKAIKQYYESLAQLKPYQAEYRYKNKDNQYRWIDEDTHIIVASDNTPIKLLGVLKDITTRKESEEKIRKSEEKYRLLAENIDDVIWKMDVNTLCYTYFSPSVTKLTGYSVEEAMELKPEQILMPDSLNDLLTVMPQWISRFNNNEPASQNKTFEYQIKHKKGFSVWVEVNAILIKDSSGNTSEIIATSRSIEERKASELSLYKSEERYGLVTKLSGYVVYDYNLINQSVAWAGAVEDILGYTNDEMEERNIEQLKNLIHPEDLYEIRENYTTESNSILKTSMHCRYLTKNKGYIWVETLAFLFTDNQNKPYRWLGIMKDITEQLRMQSLITESEEKLRTIFNTSKDGIMLLTKGLKIYDVNEAVLRRSAYSREEIIGKNFLSFISEDDNSSFAQHLLSFWEKGTMNNIETNIIINNNGSFPAEINITPIQIDKQKMLLLMIHDISEHKRLEKLLLHSVINTEEQERIHFSQELHDGLGPILSAAKMYAEWLGDPGSGVDSRLIIADLQKLLEESTRTVKDISFKLSPHILQNYGIVEAIKAYAEKAGKTTRTQITIHAVKINPFDEIIETILYRVICECISNSLKYANASNISVAFKLTESMLNIEISDNGVGFDISTVSQKHKGLGLLNIQSRLKSINGNFYMKSTANSGTQIIINVPLQD